MKAIINGRIITKDSLLQDSVMLFEEHIVDIVVKEEFNNKVNSGAYNNLEIIDAEGNYVSPGFIDLHIHGSNGRDTMDGSLEDIKIISKAIAKNGVTAFLPTTMTMNKDKIYRALDVIKQAMEEVTDGAKVLGAHLEGPFINEKYKGAQKGDYIIKPDLDSIKGYEDVIKIITIAPETDKNFEFIKAVKQNTDIALSIGHSNATFEEAMEAIKKGITRATHLFNAMTPLNHRKPGVVGAAFSSDINCELIADKIHTHPGIFQMLINIKGNDKVILITDCMRAGCMKEGISELGGQKVIVKNNAATLEDGTLAGSILTMNMAVKNIFENTKLKIYDAVALASLNPARDIKLDDKKGSLEVGKDADIIIFNDEFQVKQTITLGKTIYKEN